MTEDAQTTDRATHAQGVADALRARAGRSRARVEKQQASAYFSDEVRTGYLTEADRDDAAAFYIELGLARGVLA